MTYKDRSSKTTIMIEKTTRAKLNAVGNRGETYDGIIRRLLAKA